MAQRCGLRGSPKHSAESTFGTNLAELVMATVKMFHSVDFLLRWPVLRAVLQAQRFRLEHRLAPDLNGFFKIIIDGVIVDLDGITPAPALP